jgi:aryl-alcohol dehydrogenase-like predicted oxidoreductase
VDEPSRRRLGRTGLTPSPIGFGAFKIGRNQGAKYEHAYALPDEDACGRLLNEVLDLGIDLVDTAPAYGSSEARIGRHLASRRDEFILSTKVGETFEDGVGRFDFSAAGVRTSIERSLDRLATDRLDLVFVHSNGDDLGIIERTAVLDTLVELRERGDLRFIGFSGKTVEGHLRAISSGVVDCLMVEYHPLDERQSPVIEAASTEDVGIVIKKGLASGRLAPEDAIPRCLAPSGVSSMIIGSLAAAHLEHDLAIAAASLTRP